MKKCQPSAGTPSRLPPDERRENRFQRVKGIEDSKELFYQETPKGGRQQKQPAVAARRFVETRRKPLSGWRTGALCSTTLPPPVDEH
ncbi:hypothetical protein MJ561_13930 [Klebsiella pneumoniae]|nr:hypothetical protein MJ561_13930 [Klebsiella pneumoniae]